jgi:16S rRNA (guanine527-N7)-methyltransferase
VDESDLQDLVDHCARAYGVSLDDDQLGRIGKFLDVLDTWNRRLRLTGDRDRRTLLRKHVADAVACVPLVPDAGTFVDVGTGAGFPGAVVACVRPDVITTLVDARHRPVSFLGEVIRTVPLGRTRAVALRAEDAAVDPTIAGTQQVVTSRAVRFDRFVPLARPLLAPGGRIVSMQTPASDRAFATEVARRVGLQLLELRDYRLPDGEERRLVILG